MSTAGTARESDRAAAMPREPSFSGLPGSEPPPVCVETRIGALTLFPQRFEDIGAFSKLPPDESPSNRLRHYLPYIAARADANAEYGDSRIDETSSQQIDEDDLERIAEAYLSMPQQRPVTDDVPPVVRSMARADGESAVAYLDRRLKADHERQMENLEGTYEALGHRSEQTLASALADVDRQASSLKEIATTSMEKQNSNARERRSTPAAGTPADPHQGFGPLLASNTAGDAVNPAHDEGMALTRSIGIVTTQSAILVASLSETTTRFLRQFSEATQRLEEAARTSARTVLIAVIVMTALAAIAATAAILNYFDERDNRQSTKQWQESVVQSMKESTAAEAAQIKSLEDQVRSLRDRQNAHASTPATNAESQKTVGDTETPAQPAAKSASSKRMSKRKTSH